MKSTIAKYCALVGIVTLAAGLSINQASAASSDDIVKSVVVRYSDLDLSEPKDARALYRRIQTAALVACGEVGPNQLAHLKQFHDCVDQAVANAVAHVNSQQVTEIHEARIQRQSRS
jgi:UrcA family protein